MAALDRSLPEGFVLTFFNGTSPTGIVQLTAAATAGATSLSVARIYTNVSITSGNVGKPTNGYLPQGGVTRGTVRDLLLLGDPATIVKSSTWATTKYGCDGIAISGIGTRIENIIVAYFNGHGVWATYPVNTSTQFGNTAPWDCLELYLQDINVANCLSGITVGATDAIVDGLSVRECRDYGVLFAGFAGQVGRVHCYGISGPAIWASGNIYAQQLEGETSGYGIIFDDASSLSQVACARIFNNTYSGLGCLADDVHISSLLLQHSSSSTTTSPYTGVYTGYAVSLGSWADNFYCPSAYLGCSNGANGIHFGHNSGKALTGVRMSGILGGDGTYGFHVPFPMSGCAFDMTVAGFTNSVYFGSGVTVTGNTFTFRGASTGTITWPNGATGTFATPNTPAAITSAGNNTVNFYVY